MALINPSNLYSGGQSNWDSTPFVKFALQREAQQKAKDEALDKYFAEKNAKLTSTGMREYEIAPLSQVKNQLQDYWLKNRDNIHNISKDNGKAWGEYNKLFNTAQSIIDNSKAAAKITDEAAKLKANHPELVDRMDENTLAGLDQHSQPIYIVENGQIRENPKFKPFDFNNIAYNPKGYNAKQMADLFEEKKKFTPPDQVKEDILPTNDPYVNKVVTTFGYNVDKLKKIGEESRQEFKADRDLSWTFNKGHDLIKTPFNQWKQDHVDKFNALNDEYKKIYKKDILSPEDLYVAENITSLKIPTTKEELRTNEAKKQADREKMLSLGNSYIRSRMRYKKELGLPDEVDETTGIVFDEIGGEKDVDTFTSDTKFGIPYAKKAGRISKGIVFDESGNVMADGEVTIKKEDLPANMIVVLNNQKMTVPPYVKAIVKNGEINGVTTTNSGIVDRNGMMNFQKVYNKEPLKGSQLEFGKKSTTPNKKQVSKKEKISW